jgi:hypothetical protein
VGGAAVRWFASAHVLHRSQEEEAESMMEIILGVTLAIFGYSLAVGLLWLIGAI